MNTVGWVILGVVGLLLVSVIGVYNRMVRARNKVKNQASQIDIQLKKRFDMIGDLMGAVEGYKIHEEETLKGVTAARNAYANAGGNTGQAMEANNMLTDALGKLFAVAEAYPDLKANQNFLKLQDSEETMESNITYARQFYNDEVNKFNDLIQTFPNNMLAGVFGFKEYDLFAATEAEKQNVAIKF